jgi:hypothetical protein
MERGRYADQADKEISGDYHYQRHLRLRVFLRKFGVLWALQCWGALGQQKKGCTGKRLACGAIHQVPLGN